MTKIEYILQHCCSIFKGISLCVGRSIKSAQQCIVNVCGCMNGHFHNCSHICGLCVNEGELAVHVGVYVQLV